MSLETYWLIAPWVLIALSGVGWLAIWIARPARPTHQEQKR